MAAGLIGVIETVKLRRGKRETLRQKLGATARITAAGAVIGTAMAQRERLLVQESEPEISL